MPRAISIDQRRLLGPEGPAESESLRYSGPVCRIRAHAIREVPLLDVQLGVAHRPRRVLEQRVLLVRRHHTKQVAGLLPMIILDAMVPMGCVTLDRDRRLGEIGLVLPKPRAVGMIAERGAQI